MLSRRFLKTTAQGEAEYLWKLYGFPSPRHLILEDLAMARGVLVIEEPLDRMEARLVRKGKTGIIRVKKGISEIGRRRFAIAHELGHWELHEKISQIFSCTSDDMISSYKSSRHELEANFFAAGLLMPSMLFAEQAHGRALSFETITSLAEYFLTSLTATAIRFVELSTDYCAVVASESSKIRWWWGSDGFENRFWISAGTGLGPYTLASTCFQKGSHAVGPEEVDIASWSERGVSSECKTFIEESVYMKTYGQVLTLLRLP